MWHLVANMDSRDRTLCPIRRLSRVQTCPTSHQMEDFRKLPCCHLVSRSSVNFQKHYGPSLAGSTSPTMIEPTSQMYQTSVDLRDWQGMIDPLLELVQLTHSRQLDSNPECHQRHALHPSSGQYQCKLLALWVLRTSVWVVTDAPRWL